MDGKEITVKELDELARSLDPQKLFKLNQQLYDFRIEILRQVVDEQLLQQEAERRGLSVEQLVASDAPPVPFTEADIVAEYRKVNNAQPPDRQVTLEVARPLVIRYLTGTRKAEARAALIGRLKQAAKKRGQPVSMLLQPPRQDIDVLASDQTQGTGAIEVVEFGDYECEFCGRVKPILTNLVQKYDGRVKFVWKDFPLPNHEFAMPAAVASRCAADQGRFWEYGATLFANQRELARPQLLRYARDLGLDVVPFEACLSSDKHAAEITSSLDAASKYGVVVTPTVFINGRMIPGAVGEDVYEAIITSELEMQRGN